MKRLLLALGLVSVMVSAALGSTIRYVSKTGSDTWPYTSWATAARDMKYAVETAVTGDMVLVGDGTYQISEEISILEKGITVKSLNGPHATILDAGYPARTNRVFVLESIAGGEKRIYVEGFTIQNGYGAQGILVGGGIYMKQNATVRNCIIQNNRANLGGGVYMNFSSLLENCIIRNNIGVVQ